MIGIYDTFTDIYFWLLLIGAVFSVWGVIKIQKELKTASDFREQVLTPLTDEEEAEVTPDYKQDIERLEIHFKELNQNLADAFEVLPKRIAKSIDGSLGRAKRALTAEEEKFNEGLDMLADQHMLEQLPPFWQVVGKEIAKQVEPRTMTMFRNYIAAKPDILKQMAGNQTQNQGQIQNGIDKYIG